MWHVSFFKNVIKLWINQAFKFSFTSVKKSCLLYITGAIRPSHSNQMNLPGVQQIRGALFLDMVVNKQGQTITTIKVRYKDDFCQSAFSSANRTFIT